MCYDDCEDEANVVDVVVLAIFQGFQFANCWCIAAGGKIGRVAPTVILLISIDDS